MHCISQMFKHNQTKRMDKYSIIVVRIKRDTGEFVNSKPCKHCIERIKQHGIRKVYYSDENGNIVMEKTSSITNGQSSGHVFLTS